MRLIYLHAARWQVISLRVGCLFVFVILIHVTFLLSCVIVFSSNLGEEFSLSGGEFSLSLSLKSSGQLKARGPGRARIPAPVVRYVGRAPHYLWRPIKWTAAAAAGPLRQDDDNKHANKRANWLLAICCLQPNLQLQADLLLLLLLLQVRLSGRSTLPLCAKSRTNSSLRLNSTNSPLRLRRRRAIKICRLD